MSKEKVSAANGCDLLADSPFPCRRKFPTSSRFTPAQVRFFDLSGKQRWR
jgi:hypothetical protein